MFKEIEAPEQKPKTPEKKDGRAYPQESLVKLADEIIDELKIARESEERLAKVEDTIMDRLTPEEQGVLKEKRNKTKKSLFSRVSMEVFRKNGIEEDFFEQLRSDVGKILNARRKPGPILPLTKKQKEYIKTGSTKLMEKNRELGIGEDGELYEDDFYTMSND